MSNERPVNPSSSPLTEGLKRKRGRPKKQPRVSVHHPKSLPEGAVILTGSKEQGKGRHAMVVLPIF